MQTMLTGFEFFPADGGLQGSLGLKRCKCWFPRLLHTALFGD